MKTIQANYTLGAIALLTVLTNELVAAPGMGTAFTYQGRLTDGANAANGRYDLTFNLYNASSGGSAISTPYTTNAVGVSNGLFTVALDFGDGIFDGNARWLEAGVRTNSSGAFVILTPRQKLASTPYAITAGNLATSVCPGQLAGTYTNAVGFNNAANSYAGNGAALMGVNAATLNGLGASRFWQLGGNAGATPGTNFLGTTDNQPLEIRVNGQRALRLEPTGPGVPNFIGGWASNAVVAGSEGSTISGGGTPYAVVTSWVGTFSYTNRPNVVTSNWLETIPNYATIGGGIGNSIQGPADLSTISGGADNTITSPDGDEDGTPGGFGAIGGGRENLICGTDCVIGGGAANAIIYEAISATIGGGLSNLMDQATWSTIAGGCDNQIAWLSSGATIGGGTANNIGSAWPYGSADDCTIAGGSGNAIGPYSIGCLIGGGTENTIMDMVERCTIGGGCSNLIGGASVCIASTISGGYSNTSGGVYSTIPGGVRNSANGNYSFAAGRRAKATQQGVFVWADSTDLDYDPYAYPAKGGSSNSFNVRATGGLYFATAVNSSSGQPTSGMYVSAGGSGWNTYSDRNAKTNFATVDGRDILNRLAAIPILAWNYKTQDPSVRHLGPMAQDFNAAFEVGESDKAGERKYIHSLDADGVALAAIQGLNQISQEKDVKIRALEKDVAELKALVSKLARKVNGDEP